MISCGTDSSMMTARITFNPFLIAPGRSLDMPTFSYSK